MIEKKGTYCHLFKKHCDSKPKDSSGFNEKLYGDVGKEASKLQGVINSSGTAVEKSILEYIEYNTVCYKIINSSRYNELMNEFYTCHIIDNTFDIKDGTYLINKDIFDIKRYNKRIKPDLLFIKVKNGRITFHVYELKTGDSFDTTKSMGQKEKLTTFVEQLKLNVVKGIDIKYGIIPFFSDKPKNKLSKKGFKKYFNEDEIITQKELSELLEIDFTDFLKETFEELRDINETMFIDGLSNYPDVREKMSKNPNVINDVIDNICDDPQSIDPQRRIKLLERLEKSI